MCRRVRPIIHADTRLMFERYLAFVKAHGNRVEKKVVYEYESIFCGLLSYAKVPRACWQVYKALHFNSFIGVWCIHCICFVFLEERVHCDRTTCSPLCPCPSLLDFHSLNIIICLVCMLVWTLEDRLLTCRPLTFMQPQDVYILKVCGPCDSLHTISAAFPILYTLLPCQPPIKSLKTDTIFFQLPPL